MNDFEYGYKHPDKAYGWTKSVDWFFLHIPRKGIFRDDLLAQLMS